MKPYFAPDSYYEEDFQENECFNCKEKDERIENSAIMLKGILDILYGNEEFDSDKLEFYLEELSNSLEFKMKTSTLKIQSK